MNGAISRISAAAAALLLSTFAVSAAEDAPDSPETPRPHHEIRVGWGDMMYESAVFYNNRFKDGYRYTGHIFAEYIYNVKGWLGVGVNADFEEVMWRNTELAREDSPALGEKGNFWNLCAVPTVRFTWLDKPCVRMFSSVGAGLCVNGGTETNAAGKKTVLAPAVSLTLVGLSAGKGHWWGNFEIGGLNALLGGQEIYMIGSRMFSASLSYRF